MAEPTPRLGGGIFNGFARLLHELVHRRLIELVSRNAVGAGLCRRRMKSTRKSPSNELRYRIDAVVIDAQNLRKKNPHRGSSAIDRRGRIACVTEDFSNRVLRQKCGKKS